MNKLTQYIKTPEQIEKMRIAGRLAAKVLEMIAPHVQKNVTTERLDQLCHDYIVNELNAIPACLGYRGFPKSICTSINHVVCHGIPKDKKLKNGDIINIDVTVIKDGYHGDTSQMFMVGKVLPIHQKLCQVAQTSLYRANGQTGYFTESHRKRYRAICQISPHEFSQGFLWPWHWLRVS